MVSDPLSVLDCCLVTDGGGACVLVRADRAGDAPHKPAYLLGAAGAGWHRAISSMPDLTVTAASESGAVRAVYDLADAVRSGHPVTEHVGEEVSSRLPFRMVDLGAVGVTPDPAEWARGTDYSHASKAFADVVLPDAPYVDQTALAAAYGIAVTATMIGRAVDP